MNKKTLDPDWPVFSTKSSDEEFELLREKKDLTDVNGREYEVVTQTLENADFYQGVNMITVIRRKSDGRLFGYSWFDDISKHGESYMVCNGYEYGIECDTSADDFDWDNDYVAYWVFEPVVEASLVIYKYKDEQ